MMRKKFCPFIFSRVSIPASTSAIAKVMMVTTTISSIVFCMALMNLASANRVWKFCRPTKVSVGE